MIMGILTLRLCPTRRSMLRLLWPISKTQWTQLQNFRRQKDLSDESSKIKEALIEAD